MKKLCLLVFLFLVGACAAVKADAKLLQSDMSSAEKCVGDAVVTGLAAGQGEAVIVDAALECAGVTLSDVKTFVSQLEDAGVQKVLAEIAKRQSADAGADVADAGGQ
jgi:hypothetical protein